MRPESDTVRTEPAIINYGKFNYKRLAFFRCFKDNEIENSNAARFQQSVLFCTKCAREIGNKEFNRDAIADFTKAHTMHGRQAIEGAHMLSRLIYDAITMEPQSNESINRCSLATQKIS